MPIERGEVAVGFAAVIQPLYSEGCDPVAHGPPQRQPLVGGMQGILQINGLAISHRAGCSFDPNIHGIGSLETATQPVPKDFDRFALDAEESPIRGERGVSGPPDFPLVIADRASTCASDARSSTISPTFQLPSAIIAGVSDTRTNARPASGISSK